MCLSDVMLTHTDYVSAKTTGNTITDFFLHLLENVEVEGNIMPKAFSEMSNMLIFPRNSIISVPHLLQIVYMQERGSE